MGTPVPANYYIYPSPKEELQPAPLFVAGTLFLSPLTISSVIHIDCPPRPPVIQFEKFRLPVAPSLFSGRMWQVLCSRDGRVFPMGNLEMETSTGTSGGAGGDKRDLLHSTAAVRGPRLSVSLFSSDKLIIVFLGLLGLLLSDALAPSLAFPSNLARVVVYCGTGEDGQKICDAYIPSNHRVQREFSYREGSNQEIVFDVEMCTALEGYLYRVEDGRPAQHFLYSLMEKIRNDIERMRGPIQTFSGRMAGGERVEWPDDLRSDLGDRSEENVDASTDPYGALRAGMYLFDCVEGPPVRCSVTLPPATRKHRRYERTNRYGETMLFNLIWDAEYNEHLGEGTPAEEFLYYVTEFLTEQWDEGGLQPGSHAFYLSLLDGLRSHDHGRQLDFEPYNEWLRAVIKFFCGGSPGERFCRVELPPNRRVNEVARLNKGTEDEIKFVLDMGTELQVYLNGDDAERRSTAHEILDRLMVAVQEEIARVHGSVHDLKDEFSGAALMDWPPPLQSDLGEPSEGPPALEEQGPAEIVRVGYYHYQCHGGRRVTCFVILPLTNRVQRTFVRSRGTPDQITFKVQWDRDFDDLVSADFSVWRKFLEHVLDDLTYSWRFTQGSVDGMRYGDDLDIQVRELQQALGGTTYVDIPAEMSPEDLGDIVVRYVAGEGPIVE
ncbi:hypothetical protein CSUI_008935 [Cystoisospora suis]|uniref:Uncharacterized protein n=1 Tax=Cystoisospora suis TaxID=483139 RepID=A0A2C6KLE4_9APIC|nr:hypothetical protein CSUI_008935 [Cystoisospora suis]